MVRSEGEEYGTPGPRAAVARLPACRWGEVVRAKTVATEARWKRAPADRAALVRDLVIARLTDDDNGGPADLVAA